jgi:hypothetical protein
MVNEQLAEKQKGFQKKETALGELGTAHQNEQHFFKFSQLIIAH